jgi:hypothetical protein
MRILNWPAKRHCRDYLRSDPNSDLYRALLAVGTLHSQIERFQTDLVGADVIESKVLAKAENGSGMG